MPRKPAGVFKRGPTWGYRISRWDRRTGKKFHIHRQGFASATEAADERARALAEMDGGAPIRDSKMKLGDFLLHEWLPRAPGRDNTKWTYRFSIETYVIPAVGEWQLNQIDALGLMDYFSNLEKNGGARAKGLSRATVRGIRGLIKRALGDAVAWGLLRRNPAAGLKLPASNKNGSRRPMQVWIPEQLQSFLDHARANHEWFPAYLLMASTGIRRSECLGLAWDAVELDGDNPRIAVRQTLVVGENSKPVLREASAHDVDDDQTVKSSNAYRDVSLDPYVARSLKAHKASEARRKLHKGAGWNPHNLVFVSRSGEWINPVSFSNRFTALVKEAGLPHLRLHGLRHTFASNALKSGTIDLVHLAETLGHSDPTVTLKLYAWAIPDVKEHLQKAAAAYLLGDVAKG
jgi:integrase